jgi:glycopeptide antibiotics resistance protein
MALVSITGALSGEELQAAMARLKAMLMTRIFMVYSAVLICAGYLKWLPAGTPSSLNSQAAGQKPVRLA